ncbi:nucleoside hydrolase [Shigella flexneri]
MCRQSGLDARRCRKPTFTPQNCTAVELMGAPRESAEPVTIVSTGPRTNVALLLNSHPELHSKITYRDYGPRNGARHWTPAAEFNIYISPGSGRNCLPSGSSGDGRSGCYS